MTTNPYETNAYLREYLLFHYGRAKDIFPFSDFPRGLFRFHERLRQECLLSLRTCARPTRALDLGCGVGRFTFELARVVDEALGVDNSRTFVRAARRMAQCQRLEIPVQESGATSALRQLVLPAALARGKVAFETGDAMKLAAFRKQAFDIVAAVNLLCRLPRPRAFLSQLPPLVAAGGQLLLASPWSWLERFTPRGGWLDSRRVVDLLQPHFRLARRRDLPFLIREHRRKYQLVFSEILVFMRNT